MLESLHQGGIAAEHVVGVYLSGSVPQGATVQFISDVDLSAYILVGPAPQVSARTTSSDNSAASNSRSKRHTTGLGSFDGEAPTATAVVPLTTVHLVHCG